MRHPAWLRCVWQTSGPTWDDDRTLPRRAAPERRFEELRASAPLPPGPYLSRHSSRMVSRDRRASRISHRRLLPQVGITVERLSHMTQAVLEATPQAMRRPFG